LKSKKDTKTRSIISLSIFGVKRFTFLTLSIFGFEIVLFGSLGILPTYAPVNPDHPPSTGFYLISVLNGLSSLGRSDEIRANSLFWFEFELRQYPG
jgi:hypothetical protein